MTGMGKGSILAAAVILLLSINAGELQGAAGPFPVQLSLEECLNLAVENHPSLAEARASRAAQQAKLGQVKAGTALTGNVSISAATQTGNGEGYSSGLTVTRLVYDSGKNGLERKSQKVSIDAASESERDALLSVRTGVKGAYYSLLLKILKRDQAESAVKTYEKHLQKAKGFYEIGTAARFDVTKAEVDLSSARIDLVSAEAALDTAWAALSNAVGVSLGKVRPTSPFLSHQVLPEEENALSQALENRPDIRTARLRSVAGNLNVAIAAKGDAASVSLSGSANLSGSEFPLEDTFRVSATLSVPAFDGGLTRFRVDEARSSAQALQAAMKKTEQTVLYEVRSSLLAAKEAEARIPVAELLVRQAGENLSLAEGRYETGVGNALEVADALLTFNSAKVSHFQSLHDYSAAIAALERALGGEFR